MFVARRCVRLSAAPPWAWVPIVNRTTQTQSSPSTIALLFPLWLLLLVLYLIEYIYRLEPFYRLLKVLLFAGALAAAIKYLLTG